ncbi:Uncharacterised protein [Serratia marcescens]|nr:Uncharacterised protein [Serratia marcescens]
MVARIADVIFRRHSRHVEHVSRNLYLVVRAVAGQHFDHVAIVIAGVEVHHRIHPSRILTQRLIYQAHGFHKFRPIHFAQLAQAGDAVADRQLADRQLLVEAVDQFIGGHADLRQTLFHPGERQRQHGAVALQTAHQLGDEGAGARRIGSRHVGDNDDQIGRIVFHRFQHFIDPVIGQVAFTLSLRYLDADAAQVVYQRQTQHARQRPQFTQRQIGFLLIGGDIARQALCVPAPVAVGDGFGGDVVNARAVVRCSQLRQAAAKGLRQVMPHHADLLFDQIVIIEQPLPGGRHAAFFAVAELAAALSQHPFVVIQPLQQIVGGLTRRQFVRACQTLAVAFHLIDGKQLGLDGAAERFRFAFSASGGERLYFAVFALTS